MKNIVITGGSRGIGYGLAKEFLDREQEAWRIDQVAECMEDHRQVHQKCL